MGIWVIQPPAPISQYLTPIKFLKLNIIQPENTISRSSPYYLDPPPFLKIPHASTLPVNPSSQVFFIRDHP